MPRLSFPSRPSFNEPFESFSTTMTQTGKAETKPIIDVLLVGLGSIGTIYAYMLEKVRPP